MLCAHRVTHFCICGCVVIYSARLQIDDTSANSKRSAGLEIDDTIPSG